MPTPWLSVVIPAYNEQAGIAQTVTSIDAWLSERPGEGEIIVVDNASEDATRERVEELADGDRIRLLVNERNEGKGYSMRRGMFEARGELILHCDADCAGSLPSFPPMLEEIETADLVVGSRLAEGAALGRNKSLGRRFIGRGFVQLCRLVLREPVTDLFCGFKLWRAPVAREVYARTHLDGWVYDAEVIAMARVLGARVRETGIVWSDREGSRISMPRVFVPAVRELLAARRHVRIEAQRSRAASEPPAREATDTMP